MLVMCLVIKEAGARKNIRAVATGRRKTKLTSGTDHGTLKTSLSFRKLIVYFFARLVGSPSCVGECTKDWVTYISSKNSSVFLWSKFTAHSPMITSALAALTSRRKTRYTMVAKCNQPRRLPKMLHDVQMLPPTTT